MNCSARNERGAAAVEFALVLPILIVVLFGIVEFGRAYNAQITLTHAAREGARALAVGHTVAEAKTRVDDAATPLSLDPADVTPVGTVTPSGSDAYSCNVGNEVGVEVTYPFEFIVPLFGVDFDLSSKATMRCGG